MKKLLMPDKNQFVISREDLNDILRYQEKHDAIYVSFSELGFAVYAKRDFKKGDFIYKFSGEIITFEQTKKDNDDIGECRALQIGDNKYINTQAPGRHINHSCEPNTGIVNDIDLIALEYITAHTELRFDYSTTMDEDHFTMPCYCGKPSCREKVEDFKKIPGRKKNEYLEKGIVMKFIRDQLNINA